MSARSPRSASPGGLGPLFGDDAHPRATPPDPGARVLVGTSGYSFADWVGPFYPPGTRSSDFLRHYADHFPVVEVNATYYRIPEPQTMERMEKKTPPGFRFVVKLNQAMTHESSTEPSLYREFLEVLHPLKQAGKYDGVLAQFPWGFRRSAENVDHLSRLRERLPGEPMWVEFRHDSWATDALSETLASRSLGYCVVDEPRLDHLMPPIVLLSGPDAYVRFHGRNAANWWGGAGDRYDYEYDENELREWLARIQGLAEKARRTYLFFNNCHAGQAARNAKLMQELLRQQKLPA
jgi:uncharacterized protein YecE (DUF72 family)